METFGERLRKVRGEKSQQFVATAAGVTRETISQWERGDTNPENIGNAKLQKAVTALGTTMDYLKLGRGPAKVVTLNVDSVQGMDDEDDFDPRYGVMLPVYDMDISAGTGRAVPEFIDTRKRLHFARSWMRTIGSKETDLKIIKVNGDSMQPLLWDRDDVAIDISKKRIRDGKVFAMGYAGEARVKRLYQMAAGRLRISSDNPDKVRFPDEIIEGTALNDVEIFGQVVHKMGQGGL